MKTLVFAERSEAAIRLAAGARTVANEVVLVLIGELPATVGSADKIIHIALPTGEVYDNAADTVNAVFDSEAPDLVLIESTRHLRVIAGKLAAHVGTSVITDVIEFDGSTPVSMYFGGVAHRKLKASGVSILTIGPSVFSDVPATEVAPESAVIEEAAWVAPSAALELLEVRPIEKSGVDLFGADVVVAAGRGFAEESDLELARDLCSKLNAGLGCSRPLTEGLDWLPTEAYIGVSGQMLEPKVYIAVGISGQMQHMVGCNRAETIFAINKDKNAPIFKQCDYGLVGDLKTLLPALSAAL
ncbi:MAG: electron transfer flavoprotein subunit alpha/FixB family protein [Coriobacteriia bacterium]|nr:electron transfer flavoprotein subunit alpha/FixB family protein [Coriobacteriia bacterium]MCL2750041.1 electron transfer flavoprotein subunit alpha/FixB family protein [Coriobacteriia bacterium]